MRFRAFFVSKSVVLVFILTLILTACSSTANTAKETPKSDAAKTANNEKADAKPADSKGELQKNISIGTSVAGAAYHSVGTGVASVVSKNSPVQISVKPFSGPNAWMPLLNKGDLDIGLASSPDVRWALQGINNYKENKNVRILVQGNQVTAVPYTVRKDSNIKTVADLKGKRVASDYAGNIVVKLVLEAQLAANGLTWKDVKTVPVPSTVAGIDALRENRVDAAFGQTPTASNVLEADNAVGLRTLNLVDGVSADKVNSLPDKILKEISSRIPGGKPVVIKEGFIKEPTIIIGYPLSLVASSKLTDETAYQIVKTLFEHYQELHPLFSWLKGWTPQGMFDPNPPAPYHPGAIRYFKEKGLWNDTAEKNHQELLKLTDN